MTLAELRTEMDHRDNNSVSSGMGYPALEEVEAAELEQLGRWYRFLPSPKGSTEGKVLMRIIERFNSGGGWSPALSKSVGWEIRE
jgi:hypothetical protein